MENLYIGQEKYFGFLKARPLIGGGEVWVFQQWNQDYHVMRGMEDDPMPPRAPWLERHATTIYKFRRSAVNPFPIVLFEGSGLPVTVDTLVTVELRDPVEFIRTGQYEHDNSYKLESALLKALRGPVGGEIKPQIKMQVVSIDFHDLTPPILNQLLEDTDLTHHVRGIREFKELGLEAHVIVRDTHMPEAYKQIVHEATIAIQQQLLTVKQQLIEAAASFEVRGGELEFRKKLYETQVGFYDEIFPKIQPTIDKVIDAVAKTTMPGTGLAATVFQDIIQQSIGQITLSAQSSVTGGDNQIPSMQSSTSNQRDAHIQALYRTAQTEGWQLSPLQKSVKDEIFIDFSGKNRKATLKVPTTYPRDLATISEVRDTSTNTRIPKKQIVNALNPITSGKYDLTMLVKAVESII